MTTTIKGSDSVGPTSPPPSSNEPKSPEEKLKKLVNDLIKENRLEQDASEEFRNATLLFIDKTKHELTILQEDYQELSKEGKKMTTVRRAAMLWAFCLGFMLSSTLHFIFNNFKKYHVI